MNGKIVAAESCGTCKHFRKYYSPNMGKGYPVFLPPDAGGGACKSYADCLAEAKRLLEEEI